MKKLPKPEVINNIINNSPSRKVTALEKQETPEKWSSWYLWDGHGITDLFERVHEALKKTKKLFLKGVVILNELTKVVNLLELFEMFYINMVYAFLQIILDQMETFLHDIRSTGLYYLDLVTYHFDDSTYKAEPMIDSAYKKETESNKAFYDDIKHQMDLSTLNKIKQNPNATPADYLKGLFVPTDGIIPPIFEIYKRESYYEFINRACIAFANENDTPDPQLHRVIKSIEAVNTNDGIKDLKGRLDLTLKSTFDGVYNSFAEFGGQKFSLKCGRPNFGPDGHLKVYFIAYCFPNIVPLFTLITTLANFSIFPFNLLPNRENKRMQDILVNFDGLFEGKSWFDYQKTDVNKYDESLMQSGGFFKTRIIGDDKTKPFFYGINAAMLFGEVFEQLDNLINFVRSLLVPIDTTWAKRIKQIIYGITEEINKIIQFIDQIDGIISLIEVLASSVGLDWLFFETDEGTDGVIKKLQNATGFRKEKPTGDSYDKALEDLNAKEDEINQNHNAQNQTDGQILKARYAIAYDEESPYWKPAGFTFLYDELGLLTGYSYEVFKKTKTGYITVGEYIAQQVIITPTPEQQSTIVFLSKDNKIKDLYFDLWDLEYQLAKLKEQEVILWEQQATAEEQFVSYDPDTKELFRRALLKEQIYQKQQTELYPAQDILSQYERIINNLTSIQTHYNNWLSYLTAQDIEEKIATRDSYATIPVEETELLSEILDLQTNGKDLDSDGEYEWGSIQLQNHLDELELDLDHYVNGYYDSDGGVIITPIQDQIDSIQDEIDAMDQQHNDPTQPDVEDYESARAELVSQKAAMETIRDETIADYNSEIERFTDIIEFISEILPINYAAEIINANNDFLELKEDANESTPSSTAEEFSNQITDKESEISDMEETISALDDEINLYQILVNEKKALIYAVDLDPNYYPYNSGFKDSRGTAFTVSSPDPLDPIINGMFINQVAIQSRPAVPVEHEALFTIETDGLWKYEKELFNRQVLKQNSEYALSILETELEEIQAEYDAWIIQNIIEQEDKVYIRNGLTIDKEIFDKNSEYEILSSTRVSSYSSANAVVTTLYNTAYSLHLSSHNSLYRPDLILGSTLEQNSSNWSGNEALWLEKYKYLDLKYPGVKNSSEPGQTPCWLAPNTYGGDVNITQPTNSISQFTNEVEKWTVKINRIQKEIDNLIADEEVLNQKYKDKRTSDLSLMKEKRQLWSPNEKMFYGGVVLCYGWPSGNLEEDYFNWSEAWHNVYNDPRKEKLNTDFKSQIDKIESFFR